MSNNTVDILLKEFKTVYDQIDDIVLEQQPIQLLSSSYDCDTNKTTLSYRCPHCLQVVEQKLDGRWRNTCRVDDNCPHCGELIEKGLLAGNEPFTDTQNRRVWFSTSLGDTAVAEAAFIHKFKFDTMGLPVLSKVSRNVLFIGFVDYGTRQMFKKENGTFKKTSYFKGIKNAYRPTLFLVDEVLGVKCSYYSNFIDQVAAKSDSASALKKKTSNTKIFDVRPVDPEVITPFAISLLSEDNITEKTTNEVWCTHCGHVWTDTFNASEDNTDITCPNCGRTEKVSQYALLYYNGERLRNTIQVTETPESIDIVDIEASMDQNWQVSTAPCFLACSVEKKTGKATYYKYASSEKKWKRTSATLYFGVQKILDPDNTGIKDVFENAFQNNEFINGNVIVNYISHLITNPALKNVVTAYPEFAPWMFKGIAGEIAMNFAETTPETILGISKELYEALTPETDIYIIQKWCAKYPSMSAETALFFEKEKLYLNSGIEEALKIAKTDPDNLKEYLTTVRNEQYIKIRTAAALWTDFILYADECSNIPANIFPSSLKLARDKMFFEAKGEYAE